MSGTGTGRGGPGAVGQGEGPAGGIARDASARLSGWPALAIAGLPARAVARAVTALPRPVNVDRLLARNTLGRALLGLPGSVARGTTGSAVRPRSPGGPAGASHDDGTVEAPHDRDRHPPVGRPPGTAVDRATGPGSAVPAARPGAPATASWTDFPAPTPQRGTPALAHPSGATPSEPPTALVVPVRRPTTAATLHLAAASSVGRSGSPGAQAAGPAQHASASAGVDPGSAGSASGAAGPRSGGQGRGDDGQGADAQGADRQRADGRGGDGRSGHAGGGHGFGGHGLVAAPPEPGTGEVTTGRAASPAPSTASAAAMRSPWLGTGPALSLLSLGGATSTSPEAGAERVAARGARRVPGQPTADAVPGVDVVLGADDVRRSGAGVGLGVNGVRGPGPKETSSPPSGTSAGTPAAEVPLAGGGHRPVTLRWAPERATGVGWPPDLAGSPPGARRPDDPHTAAPPQRVAPAPPELPRDPTQRRGRSADVLAPAPPAPEAAPVQPVPEVDVLALADRVLDALGDRIQQEYERRGW